MTPLNPEIMTCTDCGEPYRGRLILACDPELPVDQWTFEGLDFPLDRYNPTDGVCPICWVDPMDYPEHFTMSPEGV